MKATYDLSQLNWRLSGWTPYLWLRDKSMEVGASPNAEIATIPANVPGSVQYSLREAGLLPDWNVGLNARQCEWVENRQWIYEVTIPDGWIESGKIYRLNCRGLDYNGWVRINDIDVATFKGSHTPYVFDLTSHLSEKNNTLRIIFDLPPRWLGQFGYTSKMTDWKPRFNYTWDWTVRLVQIGISNSIYIEKTDEQEILDFRCYTTADASNSTGTLTAKGKVSANDGALVRVSMAKDGKVVNQQELPVSQFNTDGIQWDNLPVELWWPNMQGEQPLYDLSCTLVDADGSEIDSINRRIGFKNIAWTPCKDAPAGADPWICVVNGKPTFLQGANWTPILPNFADVTEADYRKRLELYKDLGFNIMRIWGGATLERTCFYNLCDELGIMVWQEFPLSSSGGSSYPPDDENSISELSEIAKSFISRRQHHVSLLVWSGGNELVSKDETIPVNTEHPLIQRFKEICTEMDPSRRFLTSSPTGPTFYAHEHNYGKGIHWHVHGPWKAEGDLSKWNEYWSKDDSLFRSETGAPGASSVEIIRKYAGDCEVMPAVRENPYWRRGSSWWVEWPQFVAEHDREPVSLEEYVTWNQERQKKALITAASTCKNRFPCCGGIIFWMGHDCFPCTANTAIIDFDGNPKPAALAIGEIFRAKA